VSWAESSSWQIVTGVKDRLVNGRSHHPPRSSWVTTRVALSRSYSVTIGHIVISLNNFRTPISNAVAVTVVTHAQIARFGVEDDHYGRGWHTETASVVADNDSAWCTAPFVGHSIMRALASTHS